MTTEPEAVPDVEQPASLWPLSQLHPWADNPVEHPPEQIAEIRQSLKDNGWGDALVAHWPSCRLIGGHGTHQAALEILHDDPAWTVAGAPGPGLVPVRFLHGPWEQYEALALALNHATEGRRYRSPVLGSVLSRIEERRKAGQAAGFHGFPLAEVEAHLRRMNRRDNRRKRNENPDPPAPPAEPVSEPGELYELGPHRLLCADSQDEASLVQLLGDRRVGVVWTDPPFAIYGSSTGVGESVTDDRIVRPFFAGTLRQIRRAVDNFGPAYVCCDWRSWPSWWDAAKGTGMVPKNLIVWDKGAAGLGSNYGNTYELVGYFLSIPKQTAMKGDGISGIQSVLKPNIVRHERVRGAERQHNAAKPVELIQGLLENHNDHPIDRSVLDLYGGSGSTLIAADQAGWVCYMLEIEPAWCDVIRRRWTAHAQAVGADPGPGALE